MNSLPTWDEWASYLGRVGVQRRDEFYRLHALIVLAFVQPRQYVSGCSLTPPKPICASCTNKPDD